MGPYFRLFLSGQYDCRIQSYPFVGDGSRDLYDISFMPVTLPYQEAEAPLGIYSKFSHADEEASAGYYRVLLKDYDINVELTATERCGISVIHFLKESRLSF